MFRALLENLIIPVEFARARAHTADIKLYKLCVHFCFRLLVTVMNKRGRGKTRKKEIMNTLVTPEHMSVEISFHQNFHFQHLVMTDHIIFALYI